MAQITINIPDEHVEDVLNAFAQHFDYNQNQQDGETKAQFAKRMLINKIKQIVVRYMVWKSRETNDPVAQQGADNINIS